MRIVSVFLTLVMTAATALAQQSVPPPPQPAADKPAAQNQPAAEGPSLEVTMKFIQEQVSVRHIRGMAFQAYLFHLAEYIGSHGVYFVVGREVISGEFTGPQS